MQFLDVNGVRIIKAYIDNNFPKTSTLANVAFSGSYLDLSNTPIIESLTTSEIDTIWNNAT